VHISSEEIVNIVRDIRKSDISNVEQRKMHYKKVYPVFAECYTHLFDMVCAKDFDEEKFAYMLKMREQIESNKRTLEKASVEVGQKFFDIYVGKKDVKL
jgi:hypothetical protein